MKAEIKGLKNDDFRAEVSRIKSEEQDARYGRLDSVRIDAYEKVVEDRICIYDIKTGKTGLTRSRMGELAENSPKMFDGLRSIIVIETRPTP